MREKVRRLFGTVRRDSVLLHPVLMNRDQSDNIKTKKSYSIIATTGKDCSICSVTRFTIIVLKKNLFIGF